MVTLTALIDNGKCYELIRQHRWPEGVCCPHCGSMHIIKNGKDDTQPERQRYVCKSCQYHFDDLSDSVFAARHQPLRVIYRWRWYQLKPLRDQYKVRHGESFSNFQALFFYHCFS